MKTSIRLQVGMRIGIKKNSDFPAGTGSIFSSHMLGSWPGQAASRFIIDTEL